jgi:hypothetical protein
MKALLKISFAICFCCLLGCAGERMVKSENLFVSTSNPAISIKIDKTFQEQEKITNSYLPQGFVGELRETVFPFITTEGNRVTAAVLIIFTEITRPENYWTNEGNGTPDHLGPTNFVMFYGRYRSAAAARLLRLKGYDATPNYVTILWKKRCSPSTMLSVHYIEILPNQLDDFHWDTGDTSDYTWVPPKLTQDQDKFLKELIERGRQNITVIN